MTRFARGGNGFLLVGFDVEPQEIADQRPGDQRRVARRERLREGTKVIFAVREKRMDVHVAHENRRLGEGSSL